MTRLVLHNVPFPECTTTLLRCTVFPTSPAQFGKFIADETEKWGKVVRAANIRAD